MLIYLKETDYVENWLNEGTVPINLASYYRDQERNGNRTPDKNFQITIEGDDIKPGIKIIVDGILYKAPGSGKTTINVKEINGDEVLGRNITYTQAYEDGLVLSMCTELSLDIMKRFKDKKAVIQILDLEKLKESFDRQIGLISQDGLCNYTEMDERNHFLKHVSDSWQKEYRWFWRGFDKEVNVVVPKGVAREVTYKLSSN
jgi:hypothetical protein